jgi:hypothetical protein
LAKVSLFQCLVRGDNFPINIEGVEGLVGFYTTRSVEAHSPDEAEKLVLKLLRSEPVFQTVEPELRKNSGAKVHFEEIVPVRKTRRKPVNTGFVWFPME